MGDFAPAHREFGRIDAQIDARAATKFPWSALRCIVVEQVVSSSTVVSLHVQNRYPSPLKRSVHLDRPLFFRGWPNRPTVAQCLCCGVAVPCRKSRLFIRGKARGALVRFSENVNSEGDTTCTRQFYWRAFSPLQQQFRPAIPTRNAASWAQPQARSSLTRRAAARQPVPSLAGLLAYSATTQAFADNLTHNNQTNRAGVRRCAPRPFLMQDPQPMGWARGDLT